MDLLSRSFRRAAVLSTAVVFAVLLPAAAWAAENPAVVAVGAELDRRRRGIGFGIIPLFCCLVVVVIVVLAVMLVLRRRRPPS